MKFYFDDLEGENYIHYVPNAGYDLGYSMEVIQALAAFSGIVATGGRHPQLIWSLSTENNAAVLRVTADESAVSANLWAASSPTGDFRSEQWTSSPINMATKPNFEAHIDLPAEGYRAFYAEVAFPSPFGGKYSKCTRVYIIDLNGLIPEPERETGVTNWIHLRQ
jgi:PhoPQ-activated pathogenicity-related protein